MINYYVIFLYCSVQKQAMVQNKNKESSKRIKKTDTYVKLDDDFFK